ncbi:hypothetical protein A3709_19630 [Halioglobus sp. HI00S01]|uniref:hypothetical protein n=1 Tax=Halioglobus sp. HI00S01 TaxID=1822214 RepID=UPI0007C24F38|nr:hypothetical protein [Halioglobus sp. HI00S01]KZX57837.1 hypothetical protein A3709_19630 [Halioglobus sp. HI00S01]
MKSLGILTLAVLLLFSSRGALAWESCQPTCDAGCSGRAFVAYGATWVEELGELQRTRLAEEQKRRDTLTGFAAPISDDVNVLSVEELELWKAFGATVINALQMNPLSRNDLLYIDRDYRHTSYGPSAVVTPDDWYRRYHEYDTEWFADGIYRYVSDGFDESRNRSQTSSSEDLLSVTDPLSASEIANAFFSTSAVEGETRLSVDFQCDSDCWQGDVFSRLKDTVRLLTSPASPQSAIGSTADYVADKNALAVRRVAARTLIDIFSTYVDFQYLPDSILYLQEGPGGVVQEMNARPSMYTSSYAYILYGTPRTRLYGPFWSHRIYASNLTGLWREQVLLQAEELALREHSYNLLTMRLSMKALQLAAAD